MSASIQMMEITNLNGRLTTYKRANSVRLKLKREEIYFPADMECRPEHPQAS